MTKQTFKDTLRTIALMFLISAIICCNYNKKKEAKDFSNSISENESIPDSIVQFLVISASNDFRNHQPPTPIDFRHVKVGYIKSSNSEKIFILCGEFLSQENKEWTEFATIKTSGYEQYLGKTQYCQDAIVVLRGVNLTVELKHKLAEQRNI